MATFADLFIRQTRTGAVTSTGLAVVVGLAVCWLRLGEALVHLSYDSLFPFRAESPPSELVVVSLDDASEQILNQPSDRPWNRALHARLLDRLTAEGARLVVFDILFEHPIERAADDALAHAIKRNGRVVLAASFTQGPIVPGLDSAQVIPPAEIFRGVSDSWGLDALLPDADSTVRQIHPGETRIPSLAWAAAEKAGAAVARDPRARLQTRWLNYYGGPGRFSTVSYHQALAADGVRSNFFRDKFVFIGARRAIAFTGAGKDSFATPYTRWSGRFAPGVDVHATSFLNLRRGDWLTRLPWIVESLVLVLLGGAAGMGLGSLRPLAACVVALGACIIVSAGSLWLSWTTSTWFAWLIVVGLQIPMALGCSVVSYARNEHRQAQRLEKLLVLHLPAARARQLRRRPELLMPGAESREITIMFTDAADFSSIVEGMAAGDLVEMLSGYFQVAISTVHQEKGTVLKLIGDAMFAIWNAPEPQADHPLQGCRAALRLVEALRDFDKRSRYKPLYTRIGMHTGKAYVGNFGSQERFDYTAFGDSVNVSSRLEGLNKHLHTQILVSSETLDGIRSQFLARIVGSFRLKGFGRSVEVNELVGTRQRPDDPDWMRSFAAALAAFQRREFDAAEAGFNETLKQHPDDGPSTFYLTQVPEYRRKQQAGKLPGRWRGEIDMEEK